jgi:quercetin dioxygenase-like cupin family protein
VNLDGQEIAYQEGVTVILPAGSVHQLVAETESGFVAAMPSGGTIRLPYGEVVDLPWRR